MDRMRVLAAFLLALMLVLSGCKEKESLPEISVVADALLKARNVTNSRIIDVDYTFFEEYAVKPKAFRFWKMYDDRMNVLEVYYRFEETKATKVTKGSAVKVEVEIESDDIAPEEKKRECIISVGTNMFNLEVEHSIEGACVGEILQVRMSDDGIGAYQQTQGCEMRVKIVSIGNYVSSEDRMERLRQNGFESFADFYIHIFQSGMAAEAYLVYAEEKARFLEGADGACKFDLSDEDLKNYSIRVIDEFEGVAHDLSYSVKDFYTEQLGLDEDGFVEYCVENAEAEIKSILIIGLLAKKEKIDITDEDVEMFREKYSYPNDEIGTIEARYYCLEEKVLKRFGIVW